MKRSKLHNRIFPQADKIDSNLNYEVGFVPEAKRDIIHMNDFIIQEDESKQQLSDRWNDALKKISGVSQWRHLASCRRRHESGRRQHLPKPGGGLTRKKSHEQFYENLNSTLQGIASECEDSESEQEEEAEGNYFEKIRTPTPQHTKRSVRNLTKSSNKALIIYFSKLARSKNVEDELDLDFIESLLNNGAGINTQDRYGQTVFHEVARTWHCDVGKFLLEQNADINCADKFGRTPLHVAAAVNYAEMVKFLCENGANAEARTYGEEQTPVHYAAKNDAVDSLRLLLKIGCDMEARDAKKRTPLQVAAELDRSETALFLVEQGATVGVCDSSGLSALTLMVEKMPPTAKHALNQFHVTDRPNRRQYFYLNLLEPIQPGQIHHHAKTPMQAVIRGKQMNLLLHPVFRRLLNVKWNNFARRKHMQHCLVQFLFVLLWSVFGITLPVDSVSEYSKPFKDIWWRVFLEALAVLMTLYFIIQELYEWHCSVRDHKVWQTWRTNEMEKDLCYCHPRWPEEQKYIVQELERIQNSRITYFSDWWNIFDWIVYIWIVTGIIPRIVALLDNKRAADIHRDILALSLIVIWVRLLKVMRPFQALGPFIVMIGHIMRDTLRFGFLYFEFFIPYIMAFWMLFGGKERAAIMVKNQQSGDGWKDVNDLIYSVWLVAVVGDFDYNAVVTVNKTMAQILIGTYTALAGILLLNLFIALMSDTFQRVYDNAKANALMQMASSINTHQMNMGHKSDDCFRLFIHGKCAPEELYYDDDDNEEDEVLQKVTIQIKQVVDDIYEQIDEKLPSQTALPPVTQSDFNGFIQRFSEQGMKYEREIQSLNYKIDKLTNLVAILVRDDERAAALMRETDKDNDDDSNTRGGIKLQKLPSIYDLKPKMFPGNAK